MQQACAAVIGLFLFSAASAWAQGPGVTVHKAPPAVSQRIFDPKHPPRDIPLFVPGEAGLAHYEFTTDIADNIPSRLRKKVPHELFFGF